MSSSEVVGALDIGGTHVTAGRVDVAARAVEGRERVPLARTASRAEVVAAVTGAATSIARDDVRRLGLAVPGPFDYATGVSKIAHKLHGLYGVDLRSELCGALRLEADHVRFLNDAEAFLLGEWWAGAARGHRRAVGVTLGTGLGSAFIEDGKIVPRNVALYELSFRGAPVEDTISSRGLLSGYAPASAGPIEVVDVAARAEAGEKSARAAFEELGQALGEFLRPRLRAFEPGCLVVGGSIARSWELIRSKLVSELGPVASLETVTVAEHLDDAALLGAARHVAAGAG
jgi:predicted NBD/HSP70 family sugar kinase